MFRFKDKIILIISPQAWGKMRISKHHYAVALAKKENTVYFLNPPARQFMPEIKISKSKEVENLYIINYSYFFPYNLRFHARKLFDSLQAIQIKFILSKINKIDIVWCFDTNLFSNLNIFKGNISIYHPVDNITEKNQKSLLKSADFIFTVSDIIKLDLQKIYPSKDIILINHGLSDYFTEKQNVAKKETNKSKTALFMGNILLASLDRDITKKIVQEHPDVRFIFIGSYSKSNISGYGDNHADDFVHFLKHQKNVVLKGSMHPKDAAGEIKNADVLLVLINPQKDINKGSNSHKILEYLSTGKVIVANHISTYKDKPGLIEMVDEMHNENLPDLFKKVINNLNYYNSPELQKKRIQYALDNTYEKQIERIEKIISEKNNNLLPKPYKFV